MAHDYQAVVIGAGPGGYPCAIRLAQLGVKTLCIEKEYWGGVCLNVGCIPSKALIAASKRFEEIQHAAEMGIMVSGDVTMDMTKLQEWKGKVVGKLTGGISTLLKANGCEQLFGTAKIVGPNTVEVTSADGVKTITADNIVIATGSSPIEIPGFSYSDGPVLDSTQALDLPHIPKRLVVIGGGVIGLELGGMMAKLGTEVVAVEMMDQLLPGMDKDAVRVLKRRLKKDGLTAMLQAKALGWEATDDGIVVKVSDKKGEEIALPADYVLVTVGRRPNTRGLGLEDVGVTVDRFVVTDEQFRTSVPSIFAIGDVRGGAMLAHKATHEGEVCAEVIAGHNVKYDARAVPAVVYTDPEIAHVGVAEAEAKEAGRAIKVGKVPFAAIGRALTTNESDGFIKVIADGETNQIIGVTMVGFHVSDLISEACLAIEMYAEALDIGLTIHPHPTLGEGVMEAAKAALGEAIHIVNR